MSYNQYYFDSTTMFLLIGVIVADINHFIKTDVLQLVLFRQYYNVLIKRCHGGRYQPLYKIRCLTISIILIVLLCSYKEVSWWQILATFIKTDVSQLVLFRYYYYVLIKRCHGGRYQPLYKNRWLTIIIIIQIVLLCSYQKVSWWQILTTL